MEHQVAPPGGDRTTGPGQEAVCALFLSLALILVSLRFYVRARMVRRLWWDDFFLLLGTSCAVVAFVLLVAQIKSGLGRHVYYLSPRQISFILKLENMKIMIFISSLMFSRLSICLFLLRIFVINRVRRRAMHMIMALIVATNVSSAILVLPQCKPVAKLWIPTIKGTCWSQETKIAIYHYQGGVSIFIDFLLSFLPIYFLKDIKISFQTKLSTCAMMSLGVFTGVCATIRTVFVSRSSLSDFAYSQRLLYYWAPLEMNVALIAAAIPALRPLWAKRTKQNQSGEPRRADKNPRLNSTYIMMDQQIEVDPPLSQLRTRIIAERGKSQGESEIEATCLPDCNGIMKTSDICMTHFRKVEGVWIPEHSSVSDRERSVEDVV